MTPILFKGDTVQFNTNGYGGLYDAKFCVVKEQLNGEFTLTMTYPKTGINAEYILPRNFIYAKVREEEYPYYQAFRINKITDSLVSNDMLIEAQHISYDLSGYPMPEFTATGISNILWMFKNRCLVGDHNFTFDTDLGNTSSTFTTKVPRSIRNCIGGEDGSLLQMFRCELEFNQRNVHLRKRRGADNGVRIEYGKNLESFVNVKATDSAYNGIVGYWYKNNMLTKAMVMYMEYDPSDRDIEFYDQKFKILDCTSQFENQPTAKQLTNYIDRYATENKIGKVHLESMTVKFIPLSATEEYKDLAVLERVAIGDTVHVIYGGEEYSLRVIEATYDVLKERYTSIELGDRKVTIAKAIADIASEQAAAQTSSVMIPPGASISDVTSYFQSRVQTVKDLINGQSSDWENIIFITDPHGSGNKQHSQEIATYLMSNANVSMLVLGGDYSNGDWVKAEYQTYTNPLLTNGYKGATYALFGNHERRGGKTQEATDSIYNDFLADKEWLYGSPSDIYYYFDDTVRQVRYLFLNTSDGNAEYTMGDNQINFIRQAVQIPSTWSLMVFGHVTLAQMGGVTTTNVTNGTAVINAINECTGNIIGYFCGHQHIDLSETISGFQHTTLICDKLDNTNWYPGISVTDRAEGTITEQAVSVISYNLRQRKVYIRRIGAGVDHIEYTY